LAFLIKGFRKHTPIQTLYDRWDRHTFFDTTLMKINFPIPSADELKKAISEGVVINLPGHTWLAAHLLLIQQNAKILFKLGSILINKAQYQNRKAEVRYLLTSEFFQIALPSITGDEKLDLQQLFWDARQNEALLHALRDFLGHHEVDQPTDAG